MTKMPPLPSTAEGKEGQKEIEEEEMLEEVNLTRLRWNPSTVLKHSGDEGQNLHLILHSVLAWTPLLP